MLGTRLILNIVVLFITPMAFLESIKEDYNSPRPIQTILGSRSIGKSMCYAQRGIDTANLSIISPITVLNRGRARLHQRSENGADNLTFLSKLKRTCRL